MDDELSIPWTKLSADALRGVIEEFITREGTEYGAHDVPLETKVEQVQAQLERGEIEIRFDARDETINIVPVRPAAAKRERD